MWGPATPPPSAGDAPTCPLRFPGQYADEETGLHYNHHRYYDPATASYLTADPLGLLPADNNYAYVTNPTHFTDPLGLTPCEFEHPALAETRDHMGDGSIISRHPITSDEALDAGLKFLGDGYTEQGVNRGVFRSADGLRRFRIDPDSLDGKHWPDVPHVHFEIFDNPGAKKPVVNNHVPLIDETGPWQSGYGKEIIIVIQVNMIGLIRSGDDAGNYVKIQELADTPPSYLILMAHDQEFTNGYGDYWVEDYAALEDFFAESKWIIEWPTGN